MVANRSIINCGTCGQRGRRMAPDTCSRCYFRERHRRNYVPVDRPNVLQRLFKRITFAECGCWLWSGATDGRGYGQIEVGNRPKKVYAVVYTFAVGPVPKGLELDHTCETPLCANPDHLEPVTHAENIRRGGWHGKRRAA